ncbi:MAG: Bax inhibitor-1 family protein [Bacilli bacterium]
MEYYVYEEPEKKATKIVKDNGVRFSMGKVLLWLSLGLVLTGVVALSMPDFLLLCCGNNASALSTSYTVSLSIAVVVMVFSSLLMWIPSFKKDSPWTIVSYVLFTIAMGVVLSTSFLWVLGIDDKDAIASISISFFITAACYLILGVIGTVSKKNFNVITPVIFALFWGVLILSLISFFLPLEPIYIITDVISFAVILLVTAVDFNNVKRLASCYPFHNSTSLAIYCAYNLYLDFIYIFVRVLFYTVFFRNRNR